MGDRERYQRPKARNIVKKAKKSNPTNDVERPVLGFALVCSVWFGLVRSMLPEGLDQSSNWLLKHTGAYTDLQTSPSAGACSVFLSRTTEAEGDDVDGPFWGANAGGETHQMVLVGLCTDPHRVVGPRVSLLASWGHFVRCCEKGPAYRRRAVLLPPPACVGHQDAVRACHPLSPSCILSCCRLAGVQPLNSW